ncbi:hypothetical protein KR018_006858, partial [Drosophila ironensis]
REIMANIKLQSSDGVIYAVDLRIAKCFGIIKTVMKICKIPEDQDSVVPLPRVKGDILLKILSWAEHHVDDPEPNDDYVLLVGNNGGISDWDANFLNVDHRILFDLIDAADYLDIEGLEKMACQTVSDRIKIKTIEEIRRVFNI